MNVVVDLGERRKAQKTRDAKFSAMMDRRYAEYDVVSKAVRTLRRRGHNPIEIMEMLRYVADDIM